ncbi:tRNA (adenosine(37)-N6)-threonylcarbamoyltransferase complex dimerization subunit type 1 TsaB [Aquipuribacter hungaricus]|uniref:tRNA (Adenosine(37)-N6)-threonylcarbamoyltransferase complex dimerization subunit type 1 TsaB n=1 Tax=Aquipuribacter hungaricus TaxID=545624 RepID=A0ABV7WJS2_9MICO
MLILALDTSTSVLSVALLGEHEPPSAPRAARAVHEGNRPAELLAPTIKAVLADAGVGPADLTAVAAGVGPGPFTGLRAGLVTARALAHVVGVRVHGVCGLDALAAEAVAAGAPEDLLVATDARRREVYWARYRGGRRLGDPQVSDPALLAGAAVEHGLPVVGGGAALYADRLRTLGATVLLEVGASGAADGSEGLLPVAPAAAWVASLARDGLAGSGPQPLPPEPLYLRRPDVQEPGSPKRVGG